MFGGLPGSFYTEYHKLIPKSNPEEEYDLRLDLYLLFYNLNHIFVFGVRSHFSGRAPHGQQNVFTGAPCLHCRGEDGQAPSKIPTKISAVCTWGGAQDFEPIRFGHSCCFGGSSHPENNLTDWTID